MLLFRGVSELGSNAATLHFQVLPTCRAELSAVFLPQLTGQRAHSIRPEMQVGREKVM